MHDSEAEDRSHLRIVPVRDSARISLPSELPIAPLPRDHKHQQPHPTDLSGAGTWTVSGANESHCSHALDASRPSVISATRDHSEEYYHVIDASPDSTSATDKDVRLFATSTSCRLNQVISSYDFGARSAPGDEVEAAWTVGGAEEFQDTDDDNASLVVRTTRPGLPSLKLILPSIRPRSIAFRSKKSFPRRIDL
jgi:hypothetical protein